MEVAMDPKAPDQLRLPSLPRVVFERPPLVLALCQVRFATVYRVGDPAVVGQFQDALREQYPVASAPMQTMQIQVGVGDSQAGLQQAMPRTAHQFSDLQENWTVVLTSESISLETRAYADFQDFLSRMQTLLVALERTMRPAFGTRLGLRYVNEMRPGHDDWSTVVRPELLGPLMVPGIGSRTTQSIQQLGLQFPEGHQVQMGHGFLQIGAMVQPRPGSDSPSGPFYFLDFDAYQEFPRHDPLPMETDAISQRVESYHDTISDLFRWSITEQYASTLGMRGDNGR